MSERARQLRARAERELAAEDPEARASSALAMARAFLHAGGSISWDRFRALDPDVRGALTEAATEVELHRALLFARVFVAHIRAQGLLPEAPRPKTHEEILDEAIARSAARHAGEIT